MTNNEQKILGEYHAELANDQKIWLKIRFTPGMETLAQELSTGRRIYEQDWADYPTSPHTLEQPSHIGTLSPDLFPSSPISPSPAVSPSPRPVLTRRRSRHWMLDASGAFPTLFIEEHLVSFYDTLSEMRQGLNDRGPEGRGRILINIANVVSIEKVITRRSFAQNVIYPDVLGGVRYQEPGTTNIPLTIDSPQEIPLLTRFDQEMVFKINASGGVLPYRYHMLNQPSDLYITEDGWVRGFIDQDQWPASGYREFLILILVEDSSIPVQTAGLEFRYRLYSQP